MRIRWNSIVTLAAVLGILVWVQLIAAFQAPAQGQRGGGGAGAGAPAAPAAGAQAAPGGGGQGRGGGGRGGGGRGGQDATPAGPAPRLPNGKPDLSGHWANPYTPNMAGRGAVVDPVTKMPLTWDKMGDPIPESKGVMKTFDLPYTDWGRKQWANYDPVANGDYAGSCLP